MKLQLFQWIVQAHSPVRSFACLHCDTTDRPWQCQLFSSAVVLELPLFFFTLATVQLPVWLSISTFMAIVNDYWWGPGKGCSIFECGRGGNGFFSDPSTPTFFFISWSSQDHTPTFFSFKIQLFDRVFDPTPTFFSHFQKFFDPTPTFYFANPFPPWATIKNGTALRALAQRKMRCPNLTPGI